MRAFTLIEVLVAASIAALLTALIMGIVGSVLRAWSRTSSTLQAGEQAQRVFDQLEQDLQGAVFRVDANTWLAATIQPDQTSSGDAGLSNASWTAGAGGRIKPGNASPGTANSSLQLAPTSGRIEDCRFGMAGMWLRFFSNQPDNNSGALTNLSAPRAVAYQIIRMRSGPGWRYQLLRSQVRPGGSTNSTFSIGFDLFMPATTSPGYNRGDGTDQNAGNVRRPNSSQVIASDVVDFGIRFYRRDATGRLVLVFPADANGAASNSSLGFALTANPSALPPAPAGYAGKMTRAFPDVAEVFLRILTEEGARRIGLLENPPAATASTPAAWWELALAHSQVFTRRIEIPSQAF